MSRLFADYITKAKGILDANWTGSSTKPAPALYPHQWNWDSGFIAMGLSRYDTDRAMSELETLFEAQWENGMVPQIVFNPDELGHYFPEPDFWQTERSPRAPAELLTSGITMPPVHAIAVEKIYDNASRKGRTLPFIERIYPKLLALHDYLYRERDPLGEGLVYIRHPWESGIDNSPTWDIPLQRIIIDRADLPPYLRKDVGSVTDAAVRPSDDDYDRYVYLIDLFRRCGYNEASIRATCPFLIQDPLFNSILCRANESLVRLAEIIGVSPAGPQAWRSQTAAAISKKLWHEDHAMFDAYDLVTDTLIEVDTAAGFMPLFAGAASDEQADALYTHLNSCSFCTLHQGNCFTIPNYDTQKEGFDRKNYWRGPIWININWMLAHGLQRYGYTLKADSLRKDLVQLPIRFGFYEYFDSIDGTGYGTDNFSWTAALFIDLVQEFYSDEKEKGGITGYIKSVVSDDIILNSGDLMPTVDADALAMELMRSIGNLRDQFYDRERGRVDYGHLKGSPEFSRYRILTNGLRTFDLSTLIGRKAKLAFWINLYNAIVVDAIVSLDVQESVKEFPEFFRNVKYAIGPYFFSADDMEHGILRGNIRPWFHPFRPFMGRDFRRQYMIRPVDPRIHFALVCGSRSCAPIDFYRHDHIYEELDGAAESFVNSSEVIVLPEAGTVLLSEIFRWYETDFGGRNGILDFIMDYLADETSRNFIRAHSGTLQLDYLHYDWNLNR